MLFRVITLFRPRRGGSAYIAMLMFSSADIDKKVVIGCVLLAFLILVSLPFEKRYSRTVSELAANPAARFIAGVALLVLADYDIILAGIAFVVIFVWIADIHLLSMPLFTNRNRNVG